MAALATSFFEKTETGCRPAQWFGEWSVLPEHLDGWISAVQACDLQAVSAATAAAPQRPLYSLSPEGLATIEVSGPISKYSSSFQSMLGGASTLEKRQALRAAARDEKVKAVMLLIDSPGGTVTGTSDLAEEVAKTDAKKPVYAYIEDLGASAAYRIAARARRIYANAGAVVGAIGTYTILKDSSGAYAKEGVRVIRVSSGEFKGVGEPGVPITDKEVADTQRRIDAMNDLFLADVAAGRKLPMKKVREIADGRVHMAQAAKDLGLIDAVASLEEVAADIRRSAMEQDQVARQAEENETLKQRVKELTEASETASAAAAAATAKLEAIAKEQRLGDMKAKVTALANLPALADLPQALVALADAAPESFAVLERQLAAWNAQVKVAALFEEKGTTETGRTGGDQVNVDDPKALRAAADARVKDGKAKDRASAITDILREQGRL